MSEQLKQTCPHGYPIHLKSECPDCSIVLVKEAQAAEGSQRRENIKDDYNITPEEATAYNSSMRTALHELDNPTSDEVSQAIDDTLAADSERSSQLKVAYMDSLVKKADESMRYFLSDEQQKILQPIRDRLAEHISGAHRFTSVIELNNELKQNESLLAETGISSEQVAKLFYEELPAYLK